MKPLDVLAYVGRGLADAFGVMGRALVDDHDEEPTPAPGPVRVARSPLATAHQELADLAAAELAARARLNTAWAQRLTTLALATRQPTRTEGAMTREFRRIVETETGQQLPTELGEPEQSIRDRQRARQSMPHYIAHYLPALAGVLKRPERDR